MATSLTCLALLSGLAASHVTQSYRPPNAKCWDYEIPLTISAGYLSFTPPQWTGNQGLTEFITNDTTRTPESTSLVELKDPLGASVNGTADYTISSTFCMPANGSADTIILATHGLGFDKSYWNLAFEPDHYNFAQFAIEQGFAVFFYDRVGVGQSTRVSGWSAQLSQQIEILIQLTRLLKANKYTGSLSTTKPKVALAGHSFGSSISQGVAAYEPELFDALVLTGYGMNASGFNFPLVAAGWSLRVASEEPRFRRAGLNAGYVVWADLWTNILTFFHKGNYDLAAAEYSEAHKTPFGILEMFTAVDVPPTFPIPKFTGPVLLISGEYDFIFCDGYCPDVLHEPAAEVFSASRNFESYVQPGFSHGMNFHLNATGFYGVVTDFLTRNGL